MAVSSKLKLLFVLDIMRKTDEYHPLNAREIAGKLGMYGITAERKSIARDLECLEEAGYTIMRCENHNKGYYMADHLFEDYELKFLADTVNAASFLTERDSKAFVKKIRSLATPEGDSLIAATSFGDTSVKSDDSMNKIKLDAIIRAIKNRRQLSFQYYMIGKHNRRFLNREGKVYDANPYYTVFRNGDYYLVVNMTEHEDLTHFRIDLMTNVVVSEKEARNPADVPGHGETFDLQEYLRNSIHMWSGDPVRITLRCNNIMRGSIRKTFGKDIWTQEDEEDFFTISVHAVDGKGLYQWLAQYGEHVKVLSPQDVVDRHCQYLWDVLDQYGETDLP